MSDEKFSCLQENDEKVANGQYSDFYFIKMIFFTSLLLTMVTSFDAVVGSSRFDQYSPVHWT